MDFPPLPVDAHVAEIRSALGRHRAVVLSAPPGTGKTTRVPPALTDEGPVILLQPRRVAARAVSRRIADERRWTLGREIGWQIRFDQRFTRHTRLLVVTEGILTSRLQRDPLLSDFTTVVLDEFHERSIHADLGLALARQAWLARDELRIVVMSATIELGPVARFLGGCPTIEVQSAAHPLTVEYGSAPLSDAVAQMLPRTGGQVLCFLPGAREIDAASRQLAAALPAGIDVVRLHGSLDTDEQDAAIRPTRQRRVILATNIAETSLTVPGVSAVIDTGQVKVARYDPQRGIDSLSLERVTQDSADQRAGRAARLGPGIALRLWDARDRLRPHREPDIARIDLAGPLLDLLAWGGDPSAFEWFEPPADERVAAALRVLKRLGAVGAHDPPRLTPRGRRIQRVPVHPRLARVLLDGRGAPDAAVACALLSEGAATTTADFLHAIDAFDRQPVHVRHVAADLQRVAASVLGAEIAAGISELELRHALFAGYADRLAKRRDGEANRFTLASGHGATLASEAAAGRSAFVVALDVVASERDGIVESRIRAASPVEREWIAPTSTTIEHRMEGGHVRAVRVERYDAIVLSATPVSTDPAIASELLRQAWMRRQGDERARRLARRLRFAGVDVDLPALVHQASSGARSLDEIDIEGQLPFEAKRRLAELAPESLRVPSGRHTTLGYEDDGSVTASVKLQELFGLADTPKVGPNSVPVTFHLLAPNGRPVQTTRDLRSFWQRTYPEVRKELRGRYPKHPWPEDPWAAQPTHRTSRRK